MIVDFNLFISGLFWFAGRNNINKAAEIIRRSKAISFEDALERTSKLVVMNGVKNIKLTSEFCPD